MPRPPKLNNGEKHRLNILLSQEAHDILSVVYKQNPHIRISDLISELIIEKLSDPRENLRRKIKEYAIKINEMQQELRDLDDYEQKPLDDWKNPND